MTMPAEQLPIIEHRVPMPDGSYANTVAPGEIVDAMYPANRMDEPPVYIGAEKVEPVVGATLMPVNSTLRFSAAAGDRRAIYGGTVTRNCPVAPDCGNCALSGAGLTISEMSRRNCARANTTRAFEWATQDPRGRFMLLPTSRNAFVVGNESFTSEYNGDELMQQRLQSGYAVVFTESWLRERGLDEFAVGANGADGSMGVAVTQVDGETLYIPFFSMRQNMGDRDVEDQIVRRALTSYYDSKGFDEARRQQINSEMEISITLGASASLENFAHQVRLPREGEDAPEGERKLAAQVRALYPDLVARASGRITSAIMLHHLYAGALERGNIWPEFEARAGDRSLPNPINPDNCPGDGQYCHIDYRAETEYALTKQLRDMGVPAENISFDDQGVMDPASPTNNAASNRAEQNNGVKVANTNRTINAMVVRLPKKN